MYRILAINPGSTSTKVAVFEDDKQVNEFTIRHTTEELAAYDSVTDQYGFRKDLILDCLREAGVDPEGFDAIIGRGGLVKPIPSGIYEVNEALLEDLRSGQYGLHASNLGGLIAHDMAKEAGVKAYIADPVVVDELDDVARISGHPLLPRISIFHALNQKAVAKAYAKENGKDYNDLNLIVAHLGGGISVGAHKQGRVVDVNNALDGEGPFSPERAGTVPAGQFAMLCLSRQYDSRRVKKMLTGEGGLVAHLGTNNMQEVIRRSNEGDAGAKLVMDAMCYTIAKTIGSMAVVMDGKVDAILLTGGIAYNKCITDAIAEKVGFIAPVVVIPGENELEALATNALRVVKGEEMAKIYE